jgi:hypothetical protein
LKTRELTRQIRDLLEVGAEGGSCISIMPWTEGFIYYKDIDEISFHFYPGKKMIY